MPSLSDYSVAALRSLAKERGLKGVSSLRKTELIALLSRPDSGAISEEDKAAAPAVKEAHDQAYDHDRQNSNIPNNNHNSNSQNNNIPNNNHNSNSQNNNPNNNFNNNNHSNNNNFQNYSQNNNQGGHLNHHQNSRQNNYQNASRRNQNGYQNNQNQSGYQNNQNMRRGKNNPDRTPLTQEKMDSLLSGEMACGILDLQDPKDSNTYGFIRGENYLTCDNDIYVANSQIRRFGLKVGDYLEGPTRSSQGSEKCDALLQIYKINGEDPEKVRSRIPFEKLTPVFPDERLSLELENSSNAMRIMNLFSPIGKGQRGMIVSPPKAGKTTLLKEVAYAIRCNHPEVHIIILLIDERPEEVTDIKEFIQGDNVEVIYSTFDELPEHHTHVAEMVLERGKRLVEQGKDCLILLDSLTRLTRAYNLTVSPSGRTLSGGLDPSSLHMPKKFFGAARNIRGGGSLTILATALVDTGSRMDDVVFEEFKGTGNMEIVLDRKLSERRIFPAIDLFASGTRRDDLLLTQREQEAVTNIRRRIMTMKSDEVTEQILNVFYKTSDNETLVEALINMKKEAADPAVKQNGNTHTVIRSRNRSLKSQQ